MANKVYINSETAKTWTDTGGDYTMDLGSLAADGVAQICVWRGRAAPGEPSPRGHVG